MKKNNWLEKFPIANSPQEQHIGLNNPMYKNMYFPSQGNEGRVFRGLNNGQKVSVKDATGNNQVLTGPQDVSEKRMQQGGKTKQLPPTVQDSLDLYNNAKKVDHFYNKSEEYHISTANKYPTTPRSSDYNSTNDRAVEDFGKVKRVSTPNGSIDMPVGDYRQNIDAYRYKQRELNNSILNTDAPIQLFDKRISPQFDNEYTQFDNKHFPGTHAEDYVQIYQYDPIAVKPVALLTESEKKLREQRYGKQSYSESKTPQNIQQLPIPQPNQLPINIQQEQIQTRFPDTPNYNNGVMDDYHKATGLYQQGGQIKSLSPEDVAISKVLMERNRGKNFVDRAFNNNTAPTIPTNSLPGNDMDGKPYSSYSPKQHSSHLMGWSPTEDGRNIVFPYLIEESPEKLQYQGNEENAMNHALQTGQFIETPSWKTADMLSNYGYKKASGIPTGYKNGGKVNNWLDKY